MKIKHVEELVGITRKNIRFYEEQGLLSPGRADNGYREYDQADIERLKQIKLLRKLGVSTADIGRVFAGDLRLDDCLDRHLDTLDRQMENLEKMRLLGEQMIRGHVRMQDLDTDSYLEQMEQMEKEGTHFMDVEKKDRQKERRKGAITAAVLIILLAIIIPIILLAWVNRFDPIPAGVFVGYTVLSLAIGVCVVVVLFKRLQEIKGGEEDEAAKY